MKIHHKIIIGLFSVFSVSFASADDKFIIDSLPETRGNINITVVITGIANDGAQSVDYSIEEPISISSTSTVTSTSRFTLTIQFFNQDRGTSFTSITITQMSIIGEVFTISILSTNKTTNELSVLNEQTVSILSNVITITLDQNNPIQITLRHSRGDLFPSGSSGTSENLEFWGFAGPIVLLGWFWVYSDEDDSVFSLTPFGKYEYLDGVRKYYNGSSLNFKSDNVNMNWDLYKSEKFISNKFDMMYSFQTIDVNFGQYNHDDNHEIILSLVPKQSPNYFNIHYGLNFSLKHDKNLNNNNTQWDNYINIGGLFSSYNHKLNYSFDVSGKRLVPENINLEYVYNL